MPLQCPGRVPGGRDYSHTAPEGADRDLLLPLQKVRGQLFIIAERETELASALNLRMAQFQISVKVSELDEIEAMLVDQHNGYDPSDKIYKKNREINQEITIHRESMRESIIHREMAVKVDQSLSKMATIIQKYKLVPEELKYPSEEDYLVGIFDKRIFLNYRQLTGEFKTEAIKQIAFAWLSSFHSGTQEEAEARSLLTVAKVNMKVRHIQLPKTKSVQEFVGMFLGKCEESHRFTLWFLVQISQVYQGTLRMSELQSSLSNRDKTSIEGGLEHPIHWKVGLVIIDSLLESVIIVERDQPILYDEYIDVLKLMLPFAKATFDLPATIVLSLLLRRLERVFAVTSSEDPENIQELLEANFDLNDELSHTQELKTHICHKLINFLTRQMSQFYRSSISFSNLVKFSMVVQNVLPNNYFNTIEHMHSCIKVAGFNFLEELDEHNKLIHGAWGGEERLKNLTEVLEQLELDKINITYLEPISHELAQLLGVGHQVVLARMKKQFTTPISEIVHCNLEILNEQEGVDKEGYVLRLGLCLAMLDIEQPQPLPSYDLFFKVLEQYLASTEKDYSNLLEHARKTQLWIVEENSQATQNCIDFCSLLYKPFEFLLTSLKKLEEEHELTDFTKKYSDFIKLKLNTALKGQIQKYVKFLEDSLNSYFHSEPELLFKYKRMAGTRGVTGEEMTKERFSFREVTRRIFNLTFLKDQLDELVCDFIDKDIYKEMDRSIFNLEQLRLAATRHPAHQAILTNIHSVAFLISATEEHLMAKVTSITVYHFMRRLFANLYFQDEKGFFANDGDYKLSDHTFLKYQAELEELFLNISRNIPGDIIEVFSKGFSSAFFKAYRCELLDTNKFKIPVKQEKIIRYLEADLSFFCNLARQKFMTAAFVKEHIEEPCHRLLRDLQKSNQKIMDSFTEASVRNDNPECRYYLLLLNMRRDDKAEEFIQRYKKFLK